MTRIVYDDRIVFEPPKGLSIYRLAPPQAGPEALHLAARRFGIEASPARGTLSQTHLGTSFAEHGGFDIRLFAASGGLQLRHTARFEKDDGKSRLHLEDAEAARLANDALVRAGLPGPEERSEPIVQRLNFAHANRAGEHAHRIGGARILFDRVLDGLTVEGPGGRSAVYLDHAKELTGIDHLAREIHSRHARVDRLRPLDGLLEEIRRRYSADTIEIFQIHLAYYELGWHDAQEFLQPAYVAHIRVGGEDSRMRMNAIVAVPAAVNDVGPIEAVREARVQPARRRA